MSICNSIITDNPYNPLLYSKSTTSLVKSKKKDLDSIDNYFLNARKNETIPSEMRNCAIEIIAAKKEKSILKTIFEVVKKKFGFNAKGNYIAVGHTALNIKLNGIDKSTGFIAKTDNLFELLKFLFTAYFNYLMRKPSFPLTGKWTENENDLLKDPELKRFSINVSERIIHEFELYLEMAKNRKDLYVLQPGFEINDASQEHHVKNCVYSALNVFVNFFVEYKDKIDENGIFYFLDDEKEEIEAMINDILTTSSNRLYCGQSALIFNLEEWEKNRQKRSNSKLSK